MVDDPEIAKLGDEGATGKFIPCFIDEVKIQAFDRSFGQMIRQLQKQQNKIYISDHNVLRFTHGRKSIAPAIEGDTGFELNVISTEWTIYFKAIAENDLNLLESTILKVTDSFNSQFARNVYSTASSAADSAGNVVSINDSGSMALSLLEMLKRIEFGVDRNGKISLPSIHLSPETGMQLERDLALQPPEFAEELERLKQEKSKLALQKEAKRKAKFKRFK